MICEIYSGRQNKAPDDLLRYLMGRVGGNSPALLSELLLGSNTAIPQPFAISQVLPI